MKQAQIFSTALITLGVAAITPTTVQAQSWNAPGPYYGFPAWSQKLPASARFWVLTDWNSEAVLDRETGLVWQREPTENLPVTQQVAQYHCEQSKIGGRFGWRLPFVHELSSLLDTAVPTGVFLPSGHPFMLQAVPVIVSPLPFWSSTSSGSGRGLAVHFRTAPNNVVTGQADVAPGRIWCVRGGNSARP